MKKLFTLIAALLFAATVWAQSSSPKMSYQAVVRNAANELVVNRTDLTVEISIMQADTVAYKEIHNNVKTNQNGLLSLLIGMGTPNKGSLDDVDWKNAIIATSIDLGSETVSAEVPVTAVPYALYAEEINSNSEIINNIYEKLYDTLNNYYTKTKINDTLKSYLTIDGLCDSIKNKCGDFATKMDVQNAVDTLVSQSTLNNYYTKSETYSQSEINTKFEKYYTKTKINDTLKSYLTIDGLCDSIEKCEAITDIYDTLNYYYTKTKINDTLKSYLTIDGLCDSVKKCDEVAFRTADNNFTEKNTFTDTIDAKAARVLVRSVLVDGAIPSTDSSNAVSAKDLVNYVANTVVDTMKYARFTADSGQVKFTVTLAAGSSIITDYRFVEFFINGVFVGTSTDGVVTVSGNEITYDPAKNENYVLLSGDRVQIIYWVKK